eukprot:403342422
MQPKDSTSSFQSQMQGFQGNMNHSRNGPLNPNIASQQLNQPNTIDGLLTPSRAVTQAYKPRLSENNIDIKSNTVHTINRSTIRSQNGGDPVEFLLHQSHASNNALVTNNELSNQYTKISNGNNQSNYAKQTIQQQTPKMQSSGIVGYNGQNTIQIPKFTKNNTRSNLNVLQPNNLATNESLQYQQTEKILQTSTNPHFLAHTKQRNPSYASIQQSQESVFHQVSKGNNYYQTSPLQTRGAEDHNDLHNQFMDLKTIEEQLFEDNQLRSSKQLNDYILLDSQREDQQLNYDEEVPNRSKILTVANTYQKMNQENQIFSLKPSKTQTLN